MEGKVLLVTGGGSGIGAAVARRFADDGGKVAVLDLDGSRAVAIASSLPEAIGIACDVTHGPRLSRLSPWRARASARSAVS